MTFQEYMMELGESERDEDAYFIQQLIAKQKAIKRDIAVAIALFWATKRHKKRLFADISSLTAKLSHSNKTMIDTFLTSSYDNSYFHTSFALQNQTDKWHKVLSPVFPDMKWHIGGSSYAENWNYYVDRLQSDIEKTINKNLIFNGTATTAIKDIEKPFTSLHKSTTSLVDTECTYVERQAVEAASIDEDIKKYLFVVTLDTLTCEKCAELDGQIFPYTEAITGVNYPPIHPRCRCVAVPYFDDYETGTRAGRDKQGDTVQFPSGMKYSEWAGKYKPEGVKK